MSATGQGWQDIYFSAHDGLKLYGRRYQPAGDDASRRRAVVCLPGLTRNGRDFHDLSMTLSSGVDARPVYTLDFRGRGFSEHDTDPRNYAIAVEMLDVQDFLIVTGLDRPVIFGTSRGGLVAMALAAAQPNAVGGIVLNDIGPVIEQAGLTRIAAYAGRTPVPLTWQEAADHVQSLMKGTFPAVSTEQWTEVARQWFNERDGRPAPGYDPKVAESLKTAEGPPPEMWDLFKALGPFPLLVMRGEHSDILSSATLEQMRSRHPDCTTVIVPGQGHAPLLKDTASFDAVRHFLAHVDARKSGTGVEPPPKAAAGNTPAEA